MEEIRRNSSSMATQDQEHQPLDPDAEVIALSPESIMAKHGFACEICKRGFQREQNLQVHRRSHNLPWKLKQSAAAGKPKMRRLYTCPETTCARHHPSRALRDLTGIKKHFHRKHGEKVFRCELCGKKYATDCDRKAHSKTCGTKKYGCHCGTLFSRKNSFKMHRAYCDALEGEMGYKGDAPPFTTESSSGLPPSAGVLSPDLSFHSAGNQSGGRKKERGTVESFSSSTSLFQWPAGRSREEDLSCYGGCPQPAACLSATSLLPKAPAQFGPSSPPCSFVAGSTLTSLPPSPSLSSGPGLGLGLGIFSCDDDSDLPVTEMIFATNPPLLDFL